MKRKKELILEIVKMVYTISETPENPAHIILRYSGHVNNISIDIYYRGYHNSPTEKLDLLGDWVEEYPKSDFRMDVYLDEKDAIEKLMKIHDVLIMLI